jgi:hypothetical protein
VRVERLQRFALGCAIAAATGTVLGVGALETLMRIDPTKEYHFAANAIGISLIALGGLASLGGLVACLVLTVRRCWSWSLLLAWLICGPIAALWISAFDYLLRSHRAQ